MKKKRSPAQRANDKRLGEMARARAGKKRGGAKRRVKNPRKKSAGRSAKFGNLFIVAWKAGDRFKYLEQYKPQIWGTWAKGIRFTTPETAQFAARSTGKFPVLIAPENKTEMELQAALSGK
jgi:hypothetical protein